MDNDLKYMKSLIHEYQNIMPPINEDLSFYKRDNDLLKKELVNLEQDNKMLSLKLEDSFVRISSASTISHRYSDTDLMDNLKCQLNLSIKEKESVTELWKSSVRRIDYLENELKLHTAGSQCNMKIEINRVRKLYERKIKYIQGELKAAQKKLEEVMRQSQASLETKNNELTKILETQKQTIEKVKIMEQEINQLQDKYDQSRASNVSLEVKVESKDTIISELKSQTFNAQMKVAEACQVAEAALLEKDAALAREQGAQEEIVHLMKTLSEIVSETELKVKAEVNTVIEQYSTQMHKYKLELKRSQEEIEIKVVDLEKQDSKCKQLELEINSVRKSCADFENINASEKGILVKKIEDSYNNLILAERKVSQLSTENETLKKKIDQLTRAHDYTLNNKEAEKQLLESKIRSLQKELQISNSRLIQVALQVEDLNEKVTDVHMHLYKEYEEKKTQSQILLKGKINEIQSSNQKVNSDLRNQLEAQVTLNHKWKNEVRSVTEKLEHRIQELRAEIADLKQIKKDLEVQLCDAETKCTEYKDHLLVLCKEFNHMANLIIKQ